MKLLTRYAAVLFMIAVSLGACGQATSVSPTLSEEGSYPAPKVNEANPYPMATTDYSVLLQDVTPDPAKGRVTGRILYQGKPLVYNLLFLADVLKDENTGVEVSTSLDRSTAPRTLSDENGVFTFSNVTPGRYGLILLVGTDSYLLLYPDTGRAILLTVDPGETDLGQLEYSDLPVE